MDCSRLFGKRIALRSVKLPMAGTVFMKKGNDQLYVQKLSSYVFLTTTAGLFLTLYHSCHRLDKRWRVRSKPDWMRREASD